MLLKHMNLALATQSNLHGLELPDDAIVLSYLPLAHIYEVTFFRYHLITSSLTHQRSSGQWNFVSRPLAEK